MPDDAAMRRVIQTFAGGEARLVVTDEAGGRRSVEVSHEALIRHWDKLRAWIDENRDKLRTREFLRANRAEWLKHGRAPGLLDLPSLYVEAARSLYQQPGDVVIDEVRDYVEALLDHERRRQEAEEGQAARRTQSSAASDRGWPGPQPFFCCLSRSSLGERPGSPTNKGRSSFKMKRPPWPPSRTQAGQQSRPRDRSFALAAWPRSAADRRPKLDVTVAALSAAVSDLRERKVLRGHDGSVRSAAFSPDGARVVTASDDKTARVWDAATGKTITVLSGHSGRVWSAAFSPDGARVVTASEDKTARVWDAATGKELAVLSGHGEQVVSAAFSPEGGRVVTASFDNTARVWEAATGKAIAVLEGHSGLVIGAAFSPDGARVVTASEDKTARVWDAATGKTITVLSGHGEQVVSAAFSPDGRARRHGLRRQYGAGLGRGDGPGRSRFSAAMTSRS